MSFLTFGRDICSDIDAATSREWLVTNGIGGYASGTISGILTRRYHGLLVAALQPPVGRTLLLVKLDETASYDGGTYPLFANRWADGTVDPTGFHHIERFELDGTIPVWTFSVADALIEKRVWMVQGENTTHIRYDLRRAAAPLYLSIKALVNYRDFHGETRGAPPLQVNPIWRGEAHDIYGVLVRADENSLPFTLVSDEAEAEAPQGWYRDFALATEQERGFLGVEDHFMATEFHLQLKPGDSMAIIASSEAQPSLDSAKALENRRAYEAGIRAKARSRFRHAPEPVQQLLLAADQFIVRRALPEEPDGHTVIAGYPWFSDWGRDTMISLPGLALTTGRPDIARSILSTFARYVDGGMLPNNFPDAGSTPGYNTVDATLWYFEAIRAYHAATRDDRLLRELLPTLETIIDDHIRGTRYNIHADPADGLLYAGQPGLQLTWMDAKLGDWVVTPRIGKPVEINALWYHALSIMAVFARHLRLPADRYFSHARQARKSFARFWNKQAGFCFDVLDGPDGNDPALRPNQLFAVSLPAGSDDEPPLLTPAQQKSVVDTCARRLLTSYGLRTLAPDDPAYLGHYTGNQRLRDGAYHQGTAWAWLIGPFVSAHLKVYRNREQARALLLPLLDHLSGYGVGSIGEIFEADPPFKPVGAFAQAWSVAEVLRAWAATEAAPDGRG
jgi:predicted glycogen debranching enzyme